MPAWLEVKGERVSVGESCAIGRLPENNLVLDDPAVSRRHALIHAHGRGGYWLMDFGSSNGVRHNGRRISEPSQLQEADRIEIAGHALVFHERRSPSPLGKSSASIAAWKTTERITETFAPVNHAAILLDENGRITTITAQARQWLDSYFGPGTGSDTLPPRLAAWIKQELAGDRAKARRGGPPAPLVASQESKRLVVQLAERDREQQLLLLTEEQPVFSTELLQTLGLTPRESEVLHWLAEGKTNPEIGIILETSPRTVGKHVEHIYSKLGVESRTAALLYVVEKLSRNPI
jgi:DNA-binding CsgD family transcriptional regulator